jgi:hypothetical protein
VRLVVDIDTDVRRRLTALATQQDRSTAAESRVAILRHLAAHEALEGNGGAGALADAPAPATITRGRTPADDVSAA